MVKPDRLLYIHIQNKSSLFNHPVKQASTNKVFCVE